MIIVEYNNGQESEHASKLDAEIAIVAAVVDGHLSVTEVRDTETDVIYGCDWSVELVEQ